MPRYELPSDLTPEEERAARQALRAVVEAGKAEFSPWVVSGRAEALGLGALQVRRSSGAAWRSHGDLPFARRGTPTLHGRGDAR